jgi:hypothetical protein
MRSVTAVQTCKIAIGGQERNFLLTRGGMTRLKTQLGIEKDSELLGLPAESLMIPLLLEAETTPKTLDAATLPDMLPIDIEWTGRVVAAILGVSMPDPRPMTPENPATQ